MSGSKKSVVFGVCWVLLLGCSADHSIADDPRSSEDRLRTRLDGFCVEECARIASCAPPRVDCDCADGELCECTRTQSDCEEDCRSDLLEAYVGTGESCAALGLEFMDCVSATPCRELDSADACRDVRERSEPCEPDDVDPPSGPPAGGTVSCSSGFGSAGSAGGANVPNPQTTCDLGWDACSDGHGYRLICLAAAAGAASCTCFVDGLPTNTFTPSSSSCPSHAETNSACAWRLSDF